MSSRSRMAGPRHAGLRPVPIRQSPADGALLQAALRHHQEGRLADAEAGYRRLLQRDPEQPDALHLLGVIALQQGRHEDAVRQIERALRRSPDNVAFLSNLGVARQGLGDLEAARVALARAVSLDRRNLAARFNLGVTLAALGRHQEAAEQYRAALTLAPGHLGAQQNLAVALHLQGRVDESIVAYRRALLLAPNSPDLLQGLGRALHGAGKLNEATAAYEKSLALAEAISAPPAWIVALLRDLAALRHAEGRHSDALLVLDTALALDPIASGLHASRAVVLLALDRIEEATEAAQRALAADPIDTRAAPALGAALRRAGRFDEAIAAFQRALEIDPSCPEPAQVIATIFQEMAQPDAALAWCERARTIAPNAPETWTDLGAILDARSDPEGAVAAYDAALALRPDDGVRVRRATVLPPIARSLDEQHAWRARFADEVDLLDRDGLTLEDPLRQVGRTAFYLAYHGMDDRPLQEQLARLYLRAAPSLGWTAPHCRPGAWRSPVQDRRKIRVGVLSRYLANHTIGKLNRGLIARLDRRRFEVTVFQLGRTDAEAARIAASADRSYRLSDDLQTMRQQVAAAQLDLLLYPDVGMDPVTYFLAFARLAPVQVVSWGHPDTTGLPNLDLFLSADSIEPPDAERAYSERLVRLSRLPCVYQRPTPPPGPADRASLGLPEDATLYLCPQSLFKMHPEFDGALVEILRRDRRGRIVLIEGASTEWSRLLRERIGRVGGDVVDRLLILPRLSEPAFLDLLRVGDVILDPFHFGGGNTSYEALGLGLPIVTWPGAFMRSRVTLGAYGQMGVLDAVADSPAAYVELALALANDRDHRADLSARLVAASDALYDDAAALAEIEATFERAVLEAAEAAR